MAGSDDKERRDAVDAVAEHGWRVERETKRGYLIMHCSCGQHQVTLHKTPSDPRHFRNKVQYMVATCTDRVP